MIYLLSYKEITFHGDDYFNLIELWFKTSGLDINAQRDRKLLIFAIIFCLFGIMNPAMAKLAPWIMEIMLEDLAESGFIVNHIEVNAMTYCYR